MNQAADRLRLSIHKALWHDLDAALAAERKATVERIRAAVRKQYDEGQGWTLGETLAILDAEAAR